MRDDRWPEAIAVGSLGSVGTIENNLGVKARSRDVIEADGSYTLPNRRRAVSKCLKGALEFSPCSPSLSPDGISMTKFIDTSSRCVISTHTIHIQISRSGICRFSLE